MVTKVFKMVIAGIEGFLMGQSEAFNSNSAESVLVDIDCSKYFFDFNCTNFYIKRMNIKHSKETLKNICLECRVSS